jgi:hypothetical protein
MSPGALVPPTAERVCRLLLTGLAALVIVVFVIVFLLDILGPWVYGLVLALPSLIATLIGWYRSHITGKPGKSLPTFLLGYVVLFMYVGVTDMAHQWPHPYQLSRYICWIVGATLATCLFGGLGFLMLAGIKERLLLVAVRFF